MEYGKKDWQRSEGRYRSLGRESMEKEKSLSAYRPSDRENTREYRPNEMMKMESSYGGIALGANRKKELTMVAHEKRNAGGPTLEKDRREIEGNRTAPISPLRGNFRTNSHSREESALTYKVDLKETPLRMMASMQEMMEETVQSSGERNFPFLNRREEQARRKEIQEQLQESREKGDKAAYELWSRRQESFRQEQSEKEAMYRKFYRELAFTREKAGKLMQEDFAFPAGFFVPVTAQETEDGSAEESVEDENKI